MRVVVAGGSGLIGRALVADLLRSGHEVDVLTRNPRRAKQRLPADARVVEWDGGKNGSSAPDLSGADVVVNLCGLPVGPRPWTPWRRRAILASRVEPARALNRGIAALPDDRRPHAYVSASGTDWYTDREGDSATETSAPLPRASVSEHEREEPFLVAVCRAWETAAVEAEALGLRVVVLRTSFVLARGSPLLRLFALPFRLGLGGPIGSGDQWFSWVHIDDVVGLYRLAIEDERARGALNAAAPIPCRERELAASMARALHRPNWLHVPAWPIRLALGEQSTLALGSRRVAPAAALELGYRFRFAELDRATEAVLG